MTIRVLERMLKAYAQARSAYHSRDLSSSKWYVSLYDHNVASKKFLPKTNVYNYLSTVCPTLDSDKLEKISDLFYFSALYNVVDFTVRYKDGTDTVHTTIIPGHYLDKSFLDTKSVFENLNIIDHNIKYGPYLRRTNEKYRIMILGKHPGEDEEINRLNFCGKLGAQFIKHFDQIGLLKNAEVYVTNFVKFVPKIKSDSLVATFAKDCFHLLVNEIRIINPDLIVFFHSPALARLLSYELSFDNLKLYEIKKAKKKNGETVVIVPISFKITAELFKTLSKANAIKSGNYIEHIEDPKITILNTVEQINEFLQDVQRTKPKYLAFDCEWHGSHADSKSFLRCMQFAKDDKHAYIIPIHTKEGSKLLDLNTIRTHIESTLLDPDINVVGSFLYTDCSWTRKHGINLHLKYKNIPKRYTRFTNDYDPTGIILDLAAAVHVIDEQASLDLCNIVQRYVNVENWDIKTPDKGVVSDDILFIYAAKDVIFSEKIAPSVVKELNRDTNGHNLWSPYFNNLRMCSVIHEMMYYGVQVDKEIAKSIQENLEKASASILRTIREKLQWPTFDPRKTRHLVECFFGDKYVSKPQRPSGAICLNLKPIKSTNAYLNAKYRTWDNIPDKYKEYLTPSTDKIVKGILAYQSEIVRLIQQYTDIDQLLKTNFGKNAIVRLANEDNRVRSFITPFLETGRCSSSRPNLQNLSKKKDSSYKTICPTLQPIRSILTAQNGYKLVECDFVSAELYQLAVMSGDKNLLDHCVRGALPETSHDYYDIHSNIAVSAFKLNCKPTKTALKEAGKLHLRVAAKSIIYGLLYLRGTASIVQQIYAEEGIKISENEAKQIEDAFYNTYPNVKPLQELLKSVPDTKGYQFNYFGRCRRFIKATDEDVRQKQQRESVNFPFQSMVAECLNILAYRLQTIRDELKLDFRILLPWHDALVVEAKSEIAKEIAESVIPYVASTVKFKRWDIDGNAIGEDWYCMGVDTKVQ